MRSRSRFKTRSLAAMRTSTCGYDFWKLPSRGTSHSAQKPMVEVTVTTDGTGRSYRGRIGYVSPAAEFTPKTVETTELRTALVYRIRVIVDGTADELRQGMPVTIDLQPAPERTPVASRTP